MGAFKVARLYALYAHSIFNCKRRGPITTHLVIYTHVRAMHVYAYIPKADFKPDCVTFRRKHEQAIEILFPITEALDPAAD